MIFVIGSLDFNNFVMKSMLMNSHNLIKYSKSCE